jgi:hypothetical protein
MRMTSIAFAGMQRGHGQLNAAAYADLNQGSWKSDASRLNEGYRNYLHVRHPGVGRKWG